MNEKRNHKWDTYAGYTKEDLVVVPDEYLNDFLRKVKITMGRIVAFHKDKNLALIEFRSITYADNNAIPPVRRYPMKWVGIDHIKKASPKADVKELPINPGDHEQSK